ncbi:DedA family protein [Actinoplanes couchii]|uniref:Membrane protein n=1 Tax=Actinoplanes couchii TaxID=403638 RepID=A0ABQ3XI14_9ACTN|nr:DedA family protein [Actinoplanes couchii]MDR6324578.1 membrane protein DedA with SNARE-associated domain [Actinoplanes couchii]GID58130.1 membrane protein [Actinoplanes couchii]
MNSVAVPENLMPLICSPWLYLIVFAMVTVDGFLPIVPSEAVVIAVSALSATGSPNLVALIAATIAGGIAGDRIAYLLGLKAGHRVTTGKLAVARDKAGKALLRYGAVAILVGRFLPGGRAATTWTSGSVALPLSRFGLVSVLASVAWAAYMISLGRVGGSVFADMPLLGAAIGLALGTVLTAVYGLVEKRRSPSGPADAGAAAPRYREASSDARPLAGQSVG